MVGLVDGGRWVDGGGGKGVGMWEGGDEGGRWRFESGVVVHTWLVGELSWFLGVREE